MFIYLFIWVDIRTKVISHVAKALIGPDIPAEVFPHATEMTPRRPFMTCEMKRPDDRQCRVFW
jgi:hypothetical protein